MQRLFYFFILSFNFLVASSSEVDLYLHHFDKKTKKLNLSKKWNLKESGSYIPRVTTTDQFGDPIMADLSQVSPMLKVTASHVELDGQSHSIVYESLPNNGVIGVEIGYSPTELSQNPYLKQPTNITIRNITLTNFDCGILVHQGVSEVVIENCFIYKSSLGIAFLGQNGPSHANDIFNITMTGVTVTGIRDSDHQASLVALKSRIEGAYGYPPDLFMKLCFDTLNNNMQDVYTYYGMYFVYTDNVKLKNILINDVGYAKYEELSEGNNRRTIGVGLLIKNSRRFFVDSVHCNDCRSELKCVGLQLDNVVRMRLIDGIFSHNASGIKVCGVEVINDNGLDYSVDEIRFENVSCEANVAGEFVAGMDLTSSRGFAGYGLVCKFNQAGKEAYGIYTKKAQAMLLRDDTTLTTNYATRVVNDVATEKGIVAAGFYGENVMGMQVQRVSCVGMQAFNTAYGMYLKNSLSIRLEDSQFSANISFTRRSGEAAAIRAEQDAQEISKFAPCVDAASTGSHGLYMVNASKINISDCIMVSNFGHRSSGVTMKNCSTVGVFGCLISAQVANGSKLDQSFYDDNVANPRAYAIQPAHAPLLFSDMTKSTVDLVATTDLFLNKSVAIRTRQAANLEPLYNDVITFLATATLLQAALARYRLWGTAFGVHAHNVKGCLLRNSICVDNTSYNDSGVGVCFSGRCSGQLVKDCNVSYNQGWATSAQALASSTANYTYQYDLGQDKLFWETLTRPWSNYRNVNNSFAFNVLSLNPAGTLLATGDSNNQIKIWNVADGSIIETLTDHTGPVTALAWNSTGTQLATGAQSSSNNVRIYNVADWSLDRTLTHGSVGINAIAWNHDNSMLAVGSSDATNNVRVWETLLFLTSTQQTYGTAINAIAWNNNGSRLVVGSDNGGMRVYAYNGLLWSTNTTISDAHVGGVRAVTYSPDFSLIASGGADNQIKVWNGGTYALTETLSEHTDVVYSVQFSSDGEKLISGSADQSIKVWDTAIWGSSLQTLVGHTNTVTGALITGVSLLSVSLDGLLKWWYTDTWKIATDRDTSGIYIAEGGFLAQGQKDFGNGLTGDDITISADGVNAYPLVSPVGAIGAGIVLGDFIIDAYLKDNQIHYNIGNAGYAHGVLMNQSYYSVVESNLIEGAVSSIYGFCAGALDVTAHSSNTFLKNLFESNKISSFVNANYMIPFNPTDTNILSLPIVKMFNGNFNQPANDFDNIVMEYSQNNESYHVESLVNPSLHPDLKTELTNNNCWQ